jgi:WD40 repeat protein
VAHAVNEEGKPIESILFTMVGQHEDAVRTVAFTGPNSVATAGDEGVLKVWRPCENKPSLSYAFQEEVDALASLPGGTLAAGDWSGEVVLWGQPPAPPRTIVKRGPGVKALAVSPDGTRVAQGGFSKSVSIFDTGSSATHVITRGRDLIYSLAWSHDGKILAVGNKKGQILLFDIRQRGAALRETQLVGARIPFSLAFTANDEQLVVGLGDESTDNGSGGNSVAILELQKKSWQELRGHRDYVYSVAVFSSGLIASGSLDRTVRIWSLQTGQLIAVLEDAEERVNAVSFSEDGRLLAAGSGPGKLNGSPGPDNSVRLYWLGALQSSN